MLTKTEQSRRTEFLADCFASFPRFCGLLKVQPKEGGGRIPFVLTETQRRFNRQRSTRDIILKGRQVKMTTVEAARDLWWFLTKPGARVVVVCQSQTDQGPLKDIAYKFHLFIDSLRSYGVRLDFGTESATEWTLPKRDATLRIIQAGASADAAMRKGRGGTVNRLHLSEMGFWGDFAKETFNSLAESVPKEGSEVVNESTPNGAAGLYFEQWRAAVSGKSAYKPHFFGWWLDTDYRIALERGEVLSPRDETEQTLIDAGVPPEAVKWRRWKIADKSGDEEKVRQEFPNDPDTCFLVAGSSFFDAGVTRSLLMKAERPAKVTRIRSNGADAELRVWHAAETGMSYVISVDPSEGVGQVVEEGGDRRFTGGDPCAAHVYERSTGKLMASLDGQIPPWELARCLAILGKQYGDALIAVERNNHGHTVLRSLSAEQSYSHLFVDRDGRPGWLTNAVTRTPALDTLSEAHRSGHWKPQDVAILRDVQTFTFNPKTQKAEAAPGAHDDHVMAAAIGWDVLCRRAVKRSAGGLTSI